MNQAQKSAVRVIPLDSVEYSLVQSLCAQTIDQNVTNTKSGKWTEFRKVLMKVMGVRLQGKICHYYS